MKIIADSGSTKTHWRIIHDDGEISQERTQGLNPYVASDENILEEIRKSTLGKFAEKQPSLYFYGAGCKSHENKMRMLMALNEVFPGAQIVVEDDLIGAARATAGREPGIVCILGTGSNSCLYDGRGITQQVDSLGFILGDEGSGAAMGKMLVRDYLRGKLPDSLSEKLKLRGPIERDEILNKIFRAERPNQYLASYTRFILQNREDPYMASLIMRTLDDFFEAHVSNYEEHKTMPCHFVGSIAFYFADFLRKAAAKHGVTIGKILEDPIAGLTLYHNNVS